MTCALAGVLSVDLVDHVFCLLCHLSELPPIPGADIFAACAKPDGFGIKVGLLLIVEVASVKVMKAPEIPIARFGASEISEAQTRFRPPDILFGAVNLLEQHGLFECIEEFLTVHVVLPEVSHLGRTCHVGGFSVAHAPIVNGLKLAEVPDEDDGHVAEGEESRVERRFVEESAATLLETVMHSSEETAADEGHLVDNEEDDIGPCFL